MSLDGERPIKPADVMKQVDWKKAEAVVILVQMPNGQENQLFMSSLSWNEVAMLTAQLQAHLTLNLGVMKEGF